MGTFLGHIIPGSFFSTFALWWLYSILTRYYRLLYSNTNNNKVRFQSAPVYRSECCPEHSCCPNVPCATGSIPMETIAKAVCSTTGIIGELITGLDAHGRMANAGGAQHVAMYAMFLVSALVDALVQAGVGGLPQSIDYACTTVCFLGEALLFSFHMHPGITPLEMCLHHLLVYAILACAVATAAEMRWRDSALVALLRATSWLLQGTWFIQIAFALYYPGTTLDPHHHDSVAYATAMFVGDAFGCAALAMVLAVAANCYYRSMDSTPTKVGRVYLGTDDLGSDGETEPCLCSAERNECIAFTADKVVTGVESIGDA